MLSVYKGIYHYVNDVLLAPELSKPLFLCIVQLGVVCKNVGGGLALTC